MGVDPAAPPSTRVGLETAFLTAGLPPRARLEAVDALDAAVRGAGAQPAFIGVLDGRPVIGATRDDLARLSTLSGKLTTADLPVAVAGGSSGGTTVAATLHLAHRAGLAVVATGGIGGVHPGEGPADVSADLDELARTPVVLVCSGAKSILDLPATFERLETLGVTVVGYRTEEIPAFWSLESGVKARNVAADVAEVAAIWRACRELELKGALLLCVPPPADAALPSAEAEAAIRRAWEEANAQGVEGPALTPFLLGRIVELTGGRSLRANLALLERNAAVAGEIAVELAGSPLDVGSGSAGLR